MDTSATRQMEPSTKFDACSGKEYPAAETLNGRGDLISAYTAARNEVYSLQRVIEDSKVRV